MISARDVKRMAVVAAMVLLAAGPAQAEAPYTIEWARQLGTSVGDCSYSGAVDASGNAYISGYTQGNLGGTNAGGGTDAFLTKYDGSGNVLWSRQLGSAGGDDSYSVALDATGNAFISGHTGGNLGGTNAGSYDAFLAKYDGSGNHLWSRQLGTSVLDSSDSAAVDAFGNAYIAGWTQGSLGGTNAGGTDAFLAKYDGSGNLLWSRQLGTSTNDYSHAVAVDASGGVYISGYTSGDAFLAKYDGSGNPLWFQQIGTSSSDQSNSVAVDASGNIYISGSTQGNLGGTNAGGADAFLAKYDGLGTLLWSRQIGTVSDDRSYSVGVDASGNAYISGYTQGNLGGTNAGDWDAFLAKGL